MTFKEVLKTTEKFVIDNSPGILTGLGVAGAVTSVVLVTKATFRSAEMIADLERDRHNQALSGALDVKEIDTREKFELVWKEYIPAVIALSATIASIIMANQIGSRRAAALAAAFTLSEKMSEEYRDKVVKTLGIKKEEEVRAELAQDRVARTPGSDLILVTGSESVFFDELSGRYFKNDIESVRKAVNEINYEVNNSYVASLTDFYEKIGLDRNAYSDEVGWNTDALLEVRFSAILLKDNRPAICITYNQSPIHGYDRCV